jgi:uncharacterized protein DUF1553/uncharacterized protein DUF1549/cytochrome c/concanavalin A-like lectin/glucanase superfamily protein
VIPVLAPAFALLLMGLADGASGGEGPDLPREARALLSERCFACHGPDAGARKGKLRLDTFEGATAARAGGAAVVPGKPEESAMLARVSAEDPEELMPPAKSGKAPLGEAERVMLRRWIAEGARYERHWSFVPPRRAPLPEVRAPEWCRDPLDRFVLARLESAGLAPAPEAGPERLLRRVTFALTGLPPTLEELDGFLAAHAREPEAAYRAAVKRLLASPHLGEHLAVGWLDLARYADTYGYQSDVERRVWPWRDWVIAAFDRNMPYDEFLTEQLAGDRLPGATREQRLATAFQRLHRMTNEGGSVEEEFRVEAVADRVNTFGTAFLGLTLECARCHDHKFDPLATREYYALGAFFDDGDECGLYSHFTDATPTPALLLPTEEQERQLAAARAEVARLEGELDALARARAADPAYLAAAPEPVTPAPAAHYALDEIAEGKLANSVEADRPGNVYDAPALVPGARGQALRFGGDNGAAFPGVAEFAHWQPFSFALWLSVPETKPRAVVLRRSRAWTDAGSQGYQILLEEGRLSFALVHFWPGDAIAVQTAAPFPLGRFVHVVASYDGSARAAGLRLYLDGAPAELEVVRDHLVKPITGGDPGALALAERFRDVGLAGGAVDELSVFERELTALEAALLAGRAPPADPAARLAHALLTSDAEAAALRARLGEARCALAEALAAVPEIMSMEDRAEPRPAFVLRRGRYDDPDRAHPLEPGTPAVLPPLPAGGADRLALARWLTDPGHPLTARVAVNRFWQLLFGRGLVETAEDFGLRGTPPTHPELLDALALDFVEGGWDVKALLERVVLSATFRQDSHERAELAALDPAGLRLGRFPARRLSAEELRDQALAASGLLVPVVGGRSVKPWQPPGLWSFTAAGEYVPDEGDARHRRSLYTFWKRSVPPPNLALFDAARREVCVARRASTSTPQQALVLLNDPQFVEAAVALARRCAEAGTDAARLTALFRRLTGRFPEPAELAELAALHAEERAAFAADPASAAALLGPESGPEEAAELAALALVASTVLSLDASVTLR